MENILSEFRMANLDLKLTNEKLYIKTNISNETFALRSINGIGVVDMVDKYNNDLTEYKKIRQQTIGYIIYGIGAFCLGIYFASSIESKIATLLTILGGVAAIIVGFVKLDKQEEPNLHASIKIMMTGGSRDFEFDKMASGSGKIAEFVANVESTLSAYHKSNN